MRPVAPRLHGVDETTLASDSDVYMPVTVGVGFTDEGHRCWITRWRLTDEDKARIANDEDVFLFITSDGFPPVQVHVGSPFHCIET